MSSMAALPTWIIGNLPPIMMAAVAPAPASLPMLDANVVAVDSKQPQAAPRPSLVASVSEGAVGEWREIASRRLHALRQLEAGWDGRNSAPISSALVARADRILDVAFDGVAYPAPPSAVPVADGTLQLEWWLSDTRVELALDHNGDVDIWVQARDTGAEFAAEGADALSLLLKWSRRLTAEKLVTPA